MALKRVMRNVSSDGCGLQGDLSGGVRVIAGQGNLRMIDDAQGTYDGVVIDGPARYKGRRFEAEIDGDQARATFK